MKLFLKDFCQLDNSELYDILKLRCEIFIVEQNCIYQDLDDKDKLANHLFIKDNSEIIAYLRILHENIAYEDMAIGRVIVKKSHRGRGIAKILMNKAINFIIKDMKKSKIRLSGQAYLTEFYQSLGFKKVSDEYLEDGIKHFEFLYEV